jgi:hypothetical protein
MAEPPADSLLWVPEARAAQLAGTPRSTVQGWDKEGFLELPAAGVFQERHIFELLLAAAFREELTLPEAKSLWRNLRRTGTIAEFLDLAEAVLSEQDQLDLVMDTELGSVTFACDARSVLKAVRDARRPKRVYLAPLAPRIWLAREGFANFASADQIPKTRRGRPPKTASSVHSMHPER